MAVSGYLFFQGNTQEVLNYYHQVFDTTPPDVMMYEDMPEDDDSIPVALKGKVMHAEMTIFGSRLMFGDVSSKLNFGDNVSLAIVSDNQEALKKAWNKLKEKAVHIEHQLGKTFFSELYGSLTDQFKINWQFIHEE